jgi:hypothetical protein
MYPSTRADRNLQLLCILVFLREERSQQLKKGLTTLHARMDVMRFFQSGQIGWRLRCMRRAGTTHAADGFGGILLWD